jgi:hypothetical protein
MTGKETGNIAVWGTNYFKGKKQKLDSAAALAVYMSAKPFCL